MRQNNKPAPAVPCPRCGGPTTNRVLLGALSRKDNRTMVCSPCGTAEATREFQGLDPWPGFPAQIQPEF